MRKNRFGDHTPWQVELHLQPVYVYAIYKRDWQDQTSEIQRKLRTEEQDRCNHILHNLRLNTGKVCLVFEQIIESFIWWLYKSEIGGGDNIPQFGCPFFIQC